MTRLPPFSFDFPETTQLVLLDRAGGRCSSPDCSREAASSGRAVQIQANLPGGTPTDSDDDVAVHSPAENGIWLCNVCANLVESDRTAFPPGRLQLWKAEAEKRTLNALGHGATIASTGTVRQLTEQLLSWPQTLPGGHWLHRPELEQIASKLDGGARALVVLGVPGSGKSALLARLGSTLRERGLEVIAIKADHVPRDIANLQDLTVYMGLSVPIGSWLYRAGQARRTVLIIDQLDALADLVDVQTHRLSVILALVHEAIRRENVQVVCSSRAFDFEHDLRFEQLNAEKVELELPAVDVVDAALSSAGCEPGALPDDLRRLLRTPQWLKLFLRTLPVSGSQPTTWQALLQKVWEQCVLAPRSLAAAQESLLRRLARYMAKHEELWVPAALIAPQELDALTRLISEGVLIRDESTQRIGFTHQSLFEFSRARTFISEEESFAEYVLTHQESLEVRPLMWSCLSYLKAMAPERYRAELLALRIREPRYHIRLLLIEFLGRIVEPDESEVALLVPLLRDAELGAVALKSTAGSPGWFRHLLQGHLQAAMLGPQLGPVSAVLDAAWKFARAQVLDLLEQQWIPRKECAGPVVHVLLALDDWDDRALEIAQEAVALADFEHDHPLGTLVWHLAKVAPAYAVRLVAFELDRRLDRLLANVPPAAPRPPEEAGVVAQFAWRRDREPRKSLEKELHRASSFSVLIELGKSCPGPFLNHILPWFARILENAVEEDTWHDLYLDDHFIDAKRMHDLVHDVPESIGAALELLATQSPAEFVTVLQRWKTSELLGVHLLLSDGLQRLAKSNPVIVLEYLLEDRRRLSLGDVFHRDSRTVALIQAVSPHLDSVAAARLEEAIRISAPSSLVAERPVSARRAAHQLNRMHRLRLLRELPADKLSNRGRAVLEEESRVFSDDDLVEHHSSSLRVIGSPMTADQMSRANDEDIVSLFEQLPDTTEGRHPARWLEGGAAQAASEFATLAKTDPARALRLIPFLKPELNEYPVGDGVRGLADSSLPTERLEELIQDCNKRGFKSESFRTDAGWALDKRAAAPAGLSGTTVALLVDWLEDVPVGPRTKSLERDAKDDAPPFLWGWSGFGILPRGSFPALSALTRTLLSRTPPRADDWLAILEAHVSRDEEPAVWLALSEQLRYVRSADNVRSAAFLRTLFERYPDVLSTSHGVRLVAHACGWIPSDLLRQWLMQLRCADWEHGARAAGEILGLAVVWRPEIAWGRDEIDRLFATRGGGQEMLGVAGILTNLWSSSRFRPTCTQLMLRLIAHGGDDVAREVVAGLQGTHAIVDDDAAAMLKALTPYVEAFCTRRTDHSIDWVASLVRVYTKEVAAFCNALLDAMSRHQDDPPVQWYQSKTLVGLTVTLQRLPGYRAQGLDLFERLLRMGMYWAWRSLEATKKIGITPLPT